MPRNKILVIRGGAIGDFILTFPVFSALREMFPETGLEVLAYPAVGQLAVAVGLVDGTRSMESRQLAAFFAAKSDLDPEWSTYFNQFAIIISYLYDPDQNFQINVRKVTEAQFIQGPHRPDEAEGVHATEVLLKPLERLAIFGADSVPKLSLKPAAVEKKPDDKWLALHPGSGSESKNWPLPQWQALVEKLLQETDYKLLLVGGEADRVRLEALQKVLPESRGRVLRGVPLAELAVALSGCDLFMGHDSGISHLAAAAGCRCVLLWGPSKREVWCPRNPQVQVVHAGEGLPSLTVEAVWARFPPDSSG